MKILINILALCALGTAQYARHRPSQPLLLPQEKYGAPPSKLSTPIITFQSANRAKQAQTFNPETTNYRVAARFQQNNKLIQPPQTSYGIPDREIRNQQHFNQPSQFHLNNLAPVYGAPDGKNVETFDSFQQKNQLQLPVKEANDFLTDNYYRTILPRQKEDNQVEVQQIKVRKLPNFENRERKAHLESLNKSNKYERPTSTFRPATTTRKPEIIRTTTETATEAVDDEEQKMTESSVKPVRPNIAVANAFARLYLLQPDGSVHTYVREPDNININRNSGQYLQSSMQNPTIPNPFYNLNYPLLYTLGR